MLKSRWGRCTVALSVLIVACGCTRPAESPAPQSPTSQSSFRFDVQIGLAQIQGDKTEGCLAMANASIQPGAKVTLVDQPAVNQPSDTPTINEAAVVEKLAADCGNGHMSTNELLPAGPVYYRIRTSKPWESNSYVIAIVEPSGPVAVKDKKVEGDLDGDGTSESFRVCTSGEGVHYQVWTGEPLTGRPRWHWYVYAGYDTEPSCTEKEYFGPK